MPRDTSGPTGRPGRRRATSRAELEHVAFELFAEQGFERTTIDDIARAASIARRTFFHYFASKNDVPWGAFDEQLRWLREELDRYGPDVPLMEVIRRVLVDFNRVPPEEAPWHRRRMELLLRVPALQAHSTLRYQAWRQVIAEFVGRRLGEPVDALAPQAIAYAVLGVALAAYEQWLDRDDAELVALLDTAVRALASGFGASTEDPVR
ncbi:mycofactocin system transcriptional regulator [Saccharopolyspora sp. CA-218241]|uniref:mycofactocin system transcriptional regulator n=1 Tax=Saccharopolyspora sp. CA-218241 TaxID=3240027 RepID=UPI003D99600C